MHATIPLLALLLTLTRAHDSLNNYTPQDILSSVKAQQRVTVTPKQSPRMLQPKVQQIMIDKILIFPEELAHNEYSCFGTSPLKIAEGQQLIIKANGPFIVYFNTKTSYRHNTLQEYFDKVLENVTLNFMVQSVRVEREQVVSIPLNIKCASISRSFLRMKGRIHIDFLQQREQKKYEFDFILMCAGEEEIREFNKIYQPGYVFFCVYFNLVLQIYHGFNRTRAHAVLFLIFMMGSMMIGEQIVGYVFSLALFVLVVLMEKKEGNLNNKAFVLFNILWFVNCLLIAFTYFTANMGYEWNSLQIALQNIIKLHITMFLIMRLIKLRRFRYVFWYFIAVAIFALLSQGSSNINFQINFRNPLDLTCYRAELFFGLMMLPISNYFASITSWMQRLIGVLIAIACMIPLGLGIKLMGVSFVGVLFYEIRVKNMRIIYHQY